MEASEEDLLSNISSLKKSKEEGLLPEMNILISDNLSKNDKLAVNRMADRYRKEVGVEVGITTFKSENDSRQIHVYGEKVKTKIAITEKAK